jgi:hypothetical protein
MSKTSHTSITYHSPAAIMERVAGIEPASSAWKAEVLPLNYTRGTLNLFAAY